MEHLIVCYDIADPKRLVKMEKLMESFGQRLQDSVFECYLEPKQVVRLKAKVDALIVEAEDSVIYFRLCAGCHRAVEHVGVRKTLPVDTTAYVV
ncbi:MAG: CRISPR-associated endonuclease Cas2 [Abditibacteriales bacterium]|nr:CRISPR-associated endonuclease Cas2 [Abditibacteriales bacterium]MDW8365295.1 CRISPR-associated endonuclease Cas2 [Abditibacteriales bacterium]